MRAIRRDEVIVLDETIKKSVYELLAGISEALEYLQHTENEELRQVVAMGRRQVPTLIDNIRPDYHFYMRRYGGNLVPTEFVLLARP